MKKQTLIILILCILLAAVIALSVSGVIGPKDSLTGYTVRNEVLTPNSIPPLTVPEDYSFPSCP